MTKIGILGATGYTALELIKILLRHPSAEITRATSRSESGTPLGVCHGALAGQLNLDLVEFDADDFCEHVEFAFSCLPHAAASPIVKQLVDRGIKVVDFSADYRLNSVDAYNTFYESEHADPDRVGNTPYGLPELFRDQIVGADLVANPGCFPTSVILPLAPLLKAGLIGSEIIADSKTGISGAGRKAKSHLHFPECNEAVTAYGVGTHRHGPEMQQIIGRYSDCEPVIDFVPHLIPMNRGILSTLYLDPLNNSLDEITDCLQKAYQDEPFVRFVENLSSTANVAGTNFCDISVRALNKRIVIVSAIDNLIKGASGAAVQNFNVMMGHEQTTGLLGTSSV